MKKETRALSHEELVEIEERIRDVLEQYFGTQFRVSIKRKKRIKVKCKSTEQPVKSRDIYAKDSSYVTIEKFEKMKAELSQTIEQQKTDIKKLKDEKKAAEDTISDKETGITELTAKVTKLEGDNENLQNENNKLDADYKIAKKELQPFQNLINLYQKAKTINGFCPLSLDLESPLKFLFCVASEQAVGSLYEKLRYNYKAVSKKVSVAIELYNELVDFMCSINPKFTAIDELGEMDDEHHAEINQKHEGQIKTILMKGYQYSVSGTVEKKAFVEVI